MESVKLAVWDDIAYKIKPGCLGGLPERFNHRATSIMISKINKER